MELRKKQCLEKLKIKIRFSVASVHLTKLHPAFILRKNRFIFRTLIPNLEWAKVNMKTN